MAPYLGTYRGRNPFEGRTTERVYTMVARGKVFEDITADPRLLAILDAFLRPSYLLSASHAIDIYPGEVAQRLHTDDSFYPIPRPRPAISISVIGAIDAFTAENGGTVIVPRSHLWGTAELVGFAQARVAGRPVPAMKDAFSLEMPARGDRGLPRHPGPRRRRQSQRRAAHGLHQPVLRTVGAHPGELLSLCAQGPRAAHVAELQRLLGYDIMPPGFMGQVTASHPLKSLDEDWVAPVVRQEP